MERFRHLTVSLSFIFCSMAAFAGSSSFSGSMQDEQYPESRFGAPPARVRVKSEAWTSQTDFSGRGPASLSDSGANSDGAETTSGRSIASMGAAVPSELSSSVISRKGVQEVAIIASELGYFPNTIFVNRDVPVRLYVTGASKNSLCVLMDSFQVKKQIRAQKIEEITFTPGTPGKYRFYCPVNRSLEGSLVVREVSSNLKEEAAQE